MALELIELTKTYTGPDGSTVPIVHIPRFEMRDGEQVALIGSSGSGKTTLLHMIAGIVPADSGRILFTADGEQHDIATMPEARRDVFRGRHMGYIFQTHQLLPGFTAMENVLLGMSFTGRKHDVPWAKHLLESVGLGERLNYRPAKLSVGQQQRVAVARALANRPALVLADEPTGALDVNNAKQVLQLVLRLVSEVGASLLMVTHDPSIAKQLSRTVALDELNVEATGP